MDRNYGLPSYAADRIRHWHPQSQHYAGCDQLLTLMDNGWSIDGDINFDEYWHGGARRIVIYGFQMMREREKVMMQIIGNPAAERLVRDVENPLVPKRLLPASKAQSKTAAS